MITRLVAGLVVAGLTTVAGCGGTGDGGDGGDGDHVLESVPYSGDWPHEASAALLEVDFGGGLPPPEPAPVRFVEVPDVVLFGDGRVVWREGGSFLEARLEDEGVRVVLGWAESAGLLVDADPGEGDRVGPDTGEPEVFDVPSASYVVMTGSGTTETVVRAPGMERDADIGLTDEQEAARDLIAQADERFRSLDTEISGELFAAEPAPLQGVAWELLTRRATTYPEPTGDEPPWTFDDPRMQCRVVEGTATRRLQELLVQVGQNPAGASDWVFRGRRWVAFARPLLPGSAAPCAPASR